ncbi:hypothetical protein ACJVQT_23085 [Enterobacter huaxiensis]|uniref:hypothetical protein n=1 Tax=Enterobacter huaxiensis TaxID=2494702 RepID=UPI002175767E|nr:hypothetical protein [Enterobacter huaxiensis]MCS5452552.1 hypothetical protein [Enterobacter huaxiensis]
MYKINPETKAKQKWHKLLNNGYRFALVDNEENVKFAARYEYELKLMKIHHPYWKQIVITDQL